MAQNTKRILLFLFSGALVSLILLAASLPNLHLRDGTPFPGSPTTNENARPVTPVSPVLASSMPVLRGVVAIVLLIGMFYLLARLISRAHLKLILRASLLLAALILLAYVLPEVTPAQPAYFPDESFAVTAVPSINYQVTPLGQPPQILNWLVAIGVVLGMGVLLFTLVKRRWNAPKIEAEILQQAEDAIGALQAGIDLKNVIIRCYLQMTNAIQEAQGLERTDTMTAREFEGWLEQMGFPTTPVYQLTSLFEKARYSKQTTVGNDEKIALESLNEIIKFCRNGKA